MLGIYGSMKWKIARMYYHTFNEFKEAVSNSNFLQWFTAQKIHLTF